MDERQRIAAARHEAALDVLRESDSTRVPFVLYLRKFDIDVLHGPTEQERKPLDQTLFESLPPNVKMISVQDSNEIFRQLFARAVPALMLGSNEEWKQNLRPIIARAELIVSEFTFLSEGVRWELEACRELGKHHQTVLVVPPPNSSFRVLDHLAPLDQFPRVVWANEFFTSPLHESFVVKDLLQRLAEIAELSADERRRRYAEGKMQARFPIQYAEVLKGYQDRIRDWEVRAALSGDPQGCNNYCRFWDQFRAAAVLGIQIAAGTRTLVDAAFDLSYTYIEILQGIAADVVPLDQPGSFLTTDVVRKIAGSVPKLISYLPENGGKSMVQTFAALTFQRLGLQYEVASE